MSIASEITRLQGVKGDIIQAIIDKGVQVPSGAMLGDCAELITAISGGGGDVSLSMKPIVPISGGKIVVCDESGYVGLNSLPTYYPSAYTSYAIVIAGADFSSSGLGQVTIITPGASNIGGRTYRTVTINGVTWLAENLDYKASGVDIAPGGGPDTPAAWYYDNRESTYGKDGNKYGLLYNWYAVEHLNVNRATLMPGWHVPSISEWDALANAVGGASVAGTHLKSTTGWSGGNGTDDFGFSAFPAGYRNSNGSFYNVGTRANFWTATESSSSNAYYRNFGTSASMNSNNNDKASAYSVRLVKDA